MRDKMVSIWVESVLMPAHLAKTVGGFLIRAEGEVLLGLRATWKTTWPLHWDAIGGRVEAGETLSDALIREVREEVGVTPTNFDLLAFFSEQRPELYGNALHFVFAIRSWDGGEPSNVSNEHIDLKWFNIREMLTLTNLVHPSYPRLAEQALDGPIYSNALRF